MGSLEHCVKRLFDPKRGWRQRPVSTLSIIVGPAEPGCCVMHQPAQLLGKVGYLSLIKPGPKTLGGATLQTASAGTVSVSTVALTPGP